MESENNGGNGQRSRDTGIRPTMVRQGWFLVALGLVVLAAVFLTLVLVKGCSGKVGEKPVKEPARQEAKGKGEAADPVISGTPPPDKVEIPTPPPPPPPPPPEPEPGPPPTHPLEGRKRILLGSPGNWRHGQLTYTGDLGEVDYPLATVEMDDPCLWELVGEKGNKDVYSILCRTPDGKGEWDGANLTYTQFEKGGVPFATVEKGDTNLWKILPDKDNPSRYRIECFDDPNWHGKALSYEPEHDFGEAANYPIAALKDDGSVSWILLAEDDPLPERPREVTHVIIFPRADLEGEEWKTLGEEWVPEIGAHLEKKGDGVLLLRLTLADGTKLVNSYLSELGYAEVRKIVGKQNDPVAEFLPGFAKLPSLLESGEAEVDDDKRKLAPFPIVLPVMGGEDVRVDRIRGIQFEDTAFWINTLEKIDAFQSHLADDPKDSAGDGRVFRGRYFTYIFVNLEDEAPEPRE